MATQGVPDDLIQNEAGMSVETLAIRKLTEAMSLLFLHILGNSITPKLAMTGLALCREVLEMTEPK